jgi:hypothetical protein
MPPQFLNHPMPVEIALDRRVQDVEADEAREESLVIFLLAKRILYRLS